MSFVTERLRKLARFVEELDNRQEAERAFFICMLAIGVHVFLTGSFLVLYGRPPEGLSRTRDLAYGWQMAKVLSVGLALYLSCLGLIRWSYRRPRWQSVLTYLTFQMIGTYQFYLVQALGTFSTAMMIIFPADVALVFLLFDERKALFVLLYGGFLFTCIGLLEHTGAIAYAPLISEAIRPVPPPLPALMQEIFVIWTFTGLLYFILFYVHYSLRKAHRELRATKDQLVQAEALATVGSLVTGAAHELRNPLSSSNALLQSLLEELRESETLSREQVQEAIHTLEFSLKSEGRAKAIVDRLYQLTDDLAEQSSDCRLSTLLDTLAKKHKGVAVSCNSIDFSRTVSERALGTILSNLLENALAAGGSDPPTLLVEEREGIACFRVRDSGRGIPAALQPEVFKPFMTGQKAGEGHGVGLGLYIVHQLVARLNGTVTLESEEGRGTEVTVHMPMPAPVGPAR